ncbi:MAG: hypothetical protein KBC95_01040 [Candidatus Peribacteraceae bacterium]|nr:hypothetical protein [Candidatus Peribacteraceae bacterium]
MIIFTVTLLAVLFSLLVTGLSIDGDKERREIYDFERGYSSHKGTVQVVNNYNASADFIDRMIAASNEEVVENDGREKPIKRGLSLYEMQTVFETEYKWEIQDKFFNALKGSDKVIQMKYWHDYSVFPECLFLLIGPLVYLVLIGLYGVVLYVVYGKNPFKADL